MLVLSAGTLAQSFTTAEQWSESIAFGLASWIRDGHVDAYQTLCQCSLNGITRMKKLDISLLTEDAMNNFMEKQQASLDIGEPHR